MILDTSALLVSSVPAQEARQAQLTFAMARHAVVDLAQIFSLEPVKDSADRLPAERYEMLRDILCEAGVSVCRDQLSVGRLRVMRQLYEGYAEALSKYLLMPLPPWLAEEHYKDNWQTVAKLRKQAEEAYAGKMPEGAADELAQKISALAEHRHDF